MKWYESDIVSIDTETTGVNWLEDRVFGVAVGWLGEQGQIISDYFDVREEPAKYDRLRRDVHRCRRIVNHNMKFDLHMLLNDGVAIDPAKTECTGIRAALIDENLTSYTLDSLAQKYIGAKKYSEIYPELAAMFGGAATRSAQMPNLHRAPSKMVGRYARPDVELAIGLWQWQEEEIERQDLHRVWRLERDLFPRIFWMERRGIRVDEARAHELVDTLSLELEGLQKSLDDLAGFEVGTSSPKAMERLFEPREVSPGVWQSNDGTPLALTPGGKPSMNAKALESMTHPAAQKIVAIRKLTKTRDTFVSGHILGHARNGSVHPTINQTKSDISGGTVTGRLSYARPALQQIPSRDKMTASQVRPLFLPDVGQGWSYGDLDQHELRIFHHYVDNPQVIAAYREDPDLDGHQAIADMTGLPRNAPKSGGANAKQMNLAMVFNMGGGELASVMGLPYTVETKMISGKMRDFKMPGPEAQAIIDEYYQLVPGVREIAQRGRSIAKSRGYVRTILGRHMRFPGGRFAYKAPAYVYQGGAGDLNKDNMLRICEYFDEELPDARLLLNIHDEYSMSLPDDCDAQRHLTAIQERIQDRRELRVPIRIDFSHPCANWWAATQSEAIT